LYAVKDYLTVLRFWGNIEVKSIRRLPKHPLKHHVEQLHFYLAALNCQNGFIIYLEKSALKHRVFPVKFELKPFLTGCLERAQKLHNALITDGRPKPDAQPWECRFCEFKNECVEGMEAEYEWMKVRKRKTFWIRLVQIKSLVLDTQQIRMKLIQSLQELFETASRWAEEDSDAMRIAGYIAQVLNNLAKSYEERQFNNDLKEIESLIQQAKGVLKQKFERGEGVEIRPSNT
jgi:hypothetical protein